LTAATGAVFVGEGKFTAAVLLNDFEKATERLLGADALESDFKTAVFRFSDDTFDRLGQSASAKRGNRSASKTCRCSDAVLKQLVRICGIASPRSSSIQET